ncbi:hypothetical protein [Paenibacillus contaminans]|jgi:hypothetical protein|uniref:hypothetical protein n=1 Tax=Paenibacillus contaminans TaxID=450362 RepID=UPI0018648FF7|nr:hypothetical protein [Paenibacillus contaminans]
MDEQHKRDIVNRAIREGIINDPYWLEQFNEPLPAWAVLEIVLKLLDRLEPPYDSYD